MAQNAFVASPRITASTACGGGAHGVQDGRPGMRRKIGVGIDMGDAPLGRDELRQGLAIALVMGKKREVGIGGLRLAPLERGEARILERAPNGAQAIRPLGMARRGFVLEADRVREIKRGHVNAAAVGETKGCLCAAQSRALRPESGSSPMDTSKAGWRTALPVARLRRLEHICVGTV